uniref:Uncharacterized protein n=1 Tax=Romanomermis culicivorax TaxID=13658 RepID=A0A915K478_ROMCU
MSACIPALSFVKQWTIFSSKGQKLEIFGAMHREDKSQIPLIRPVDVLQEATMIPNTRRMKALL